MTLLKERPKAIRFGSKKDDYKTILRKIHNHVRFLDRDCPVKMIDDQNRWILRQGMYQEALLKAFKVFREQMSMVERQIQKNKIVYEYKWVINTNACIRLLWKLNKKDFVSLCRRYERSNIDNPLIEELIKERTKVHQFMDKYLTLKRIY